MAESPQVMVLDSSAVLAAAQNELGGDLVKRSANGAFVSTVNLVEILERLSRRGGTADRTLSFLAEAGIICTEFTFNQAALASGFVSRFRVKNIGLGDAACLALATELGSPVMTTDRSWATLDLPLDIRVIR